jgi:hypothetical protein
MVYHSLARRERDSKRKREVKEFALIRASGGSSRWISGHTEVWVDTMRIVWCSGQMETGNAATDWPCCGTLSSLIGSVALTKS